MRFALGIIITGMILLTSCKDDRILFAGYKPVPANGWGIRDTIGFTVPVTDTVSRYDIYILLRNNEAYPYSNLYLISGVRFPGRTYISDTLEYEMTDAAGRFLGSGFGSVKENKLVLKENVRFRHAGEYRITVRQSMRKRNSVTPIDPLPGITDVGISIEKTDTRE